jgi:2-amino-4-hydroxy-6-hydroxymethyldihydropteridine diphosphokinase
VNIVYLSLGSNLGDREKNLKQAVMLLSSHWKILSVSSIWETEPLYVVDQPQFLNCVLAGNTQADEHELLAVTKEIERSMGRDFSKKSEKGPRVIDIDILLFNRLIMNDDDLVIPHPGIKERRFVLMPLMEIAPELTDPTSGRPYSSFIDAVLYQNARVYAKWTE